MKVIAVTPAGRRRYLELLAKYVLSDEAVAEWHLWDNLYPIPRRSQDQDRLAAELKGRQPIDQQVLSHDDRSERLLRQAR